jgi:hypothetical protein
MLYRLRYRLIFLFRFLFWLLPVFLLWTLPVCIVWRGPRGALSLALRGLRWCLRLVWACICAQARLMRASPFAFYRAMCRRRDWIVAKVEYVNGESAKWRVLFTTVRLPYTGLRAMGINPQTCVGILVAGGTVGGGVIVNETVFAERSFSRGDAGTYSAPTDIPVVYSDSDNTLKIDLGTTPVGQITIENVSVGTAFQGSALPSGQTNVVSIGGTATTTGFTQTWVEIGHLIVDRWRCTSFVMDNVEAHTLNIRYNASDGQSISPVAGTPRARGIGGGNRADSMVTSGGTYDQIRIGAPTSGVNGKVDVLRLSNLLTKGGACVLRLIKAGTIDLEFMEVGAGNGFATKEFVVATSTIYKIADIKDNVEVAISPP